MPFSLHSSQSFLGVLTLVLVALCFQIASAQTDDPTDGETDPVKLFERGQNAHAKGDLSRALVLYEGAIDRGALELVGGQRIAVVDLAGVEVPRR